MDVLEMSENKIFVGGLDYNSGEQAVSQHFSQWGPVQCTIKRFPDGRSRGFAFAMFASREDMEICLRDPEHRIDGKRVDLRRADRDKESMGGQVREAMPSRLVPGIRGIKRPHGPGQADAKRIFIGGPDSEKSVGGSHGLTEVVTDRDLETHFGQFGAVKMVEQLVWRDSGRKRGYGYIHMESEEAVEAVVGAGIHTVAGARLQAKRDNPGASGQGWGGGAKRTRLEPLDRNNIIMRRILVRGLSYDVQESKLREYFSQYGEVTDIHLPVHFDTKKKKGFGYITFSDVDAVDDVQRGRPHQMDGRNTETTRATPKEQLGNPEAEARSKRLYIGGCSDARGSGSASGLAESTSDTDLERYFGQFGRVLSVSQKVWQDSGKKRGYGYVEFDDEDPVDKIVLLRIHNVGDSRLECKKGLSRDQMQAGGGRVVETFSDRPPPLPSGSWERSVVRSSSSSLVGLQGGSDYRSDYSSGRGYSPAPQYGSSSGAAQPRGYNSANHWSSTSPSGYSSANHWSSGNTNEGWW